MGVRKVLLLEENTHACPDGRISKGAIRDQVRRFIQSNFTSGEELQLEDGQSLLGSGILDSSGMLELIAFVEEKFDVRFSDRDLEAEDFDTIDKVADRVFRRLTVRPNGLAPRL
jgi:acyl carrier protein